MTKLELIFFLACTTIMVSSASAETLVSFPDLNMNVSLRNNGTYTRFDIRAANLTTDSFWMAAGFNTEPKMKNSNIAICQSTGSVGHYYNLNYAIPQLISLGSPSFALRNTSVSVADSIAMCSYIRKNMNPAAVDQHYYQLEENSLPYLVVARGELISNFTRISYHYGNRGVEQLLSGVDIHTPTTTRSPPPPSPIVPVLPSVPVPPPVEDNGGGVLDWVSGAWDTVTSIF
jgi:hypothetical protein